MSNGNCEVHEQRYKKSAYCSIWYSGSIQEILKIIIVIIFAIVNPHHHHCLEAFLQGNVKNALVGHDLLIYLKNPPPISTHLSLLLATDTPKIHPSHLY